MLNKSNFELSIVTFQYSTVNSEMFANSVKRYICQVKNTRLWHDLPTLVTNKEFSAFRESFIFAKLRIHEVSRK